LIVRRSIARFDHRIDSADLIPRTQIGTRQFAAGEATKAH
jgi:hypothetical protein